MLNFIKELSFWSFLKNHSRSFYIFFICSVFPQYSLSQRREYSDYYDDYGANIGGGSLLTLLLFGGPFLLAHRHYGSNDQKYGRSLLRWFLIFWGSFILFAIGGFLDYYTVGSLMIVFYGLFLTDK